MNGCRFVGDGLGAGATAEGFYREDGGRTSRVPLVGQVHPAGAVLAHGAAPPEAEP